MQLDWRTDHRGWLKDSSWKQKPFLSPLSEAWVLCWTLTEGEMCISFYNVIGRSIGVFKPQWNSLQRQESPLSYFSMKGHSVASAASSLPLGLWSNGWWQEKRLFRASYTLHNCRSDGQRALGHVNWAFSFRMGHKYSSDMFISWQRQRMTHTYTANNGI